MSSELLEKLVAANDFALPEVLIEREIDSLMNDSRQYVGRAGITWDDYLRESGKTEAELRDGYREDARRRVKTTLLVEAIAKKEGVQATQADVEAELLGGGAASDRCSSVSESKSSRLLRHSAAITGSKAWLSTWAARSGSMSGQSPVTPKVPSRR